MKEEKYFRGNGSLSLLYGSFSSFLKMLEKTKSFRIAFQKVIVPLANYFVFRTKSFVIIMNPKGIIESSNIKCQNKSLLNENMFDQY